MKKYDTFFITIFAWGILAAAVGGYFYTFSLNISVSTSASVPTELMGYITAPAPTNVYNLGLLQLQMFWFVGSTACAVAGVALLGCIEVIKAINLAQKELKAD